MTQDLRVIDPDGKPKYLRIQDHGVAEIKFWMFKLLYPDGSDDVIYAALDKGTPVKKGGRTFYVADVVVNMDDFCLEMYLVENRME